MHSGMRGLRVAAVAALAVLAAFSSGARAQDERLRASIALPQAERLENLGICPVVRDGSPLTDADIDATVAALSRVEGAVHDGAALVAVLKYVSRNPREIETLLREAPLAFGMREFVDITEQVGLDGVEVHVAPRVASTDRQYLAMTMRCPGEEISLAHDDGSEAGTIADLPRDSSYLAIELTYVSENEAIVEYFGLLDLCGNGTAFGSRAYALGTAGLESVGAAQGAARSSGGWSGWFPPPPHVPRGGGSDYRQ